MSLACDLIRCSWPALVWFILVDLIWLTVGKLFSNYVAAYQLNDPLFCNSEKNNIRTQEIIGGRILIAHWVSHLASAGDTS